MNLYHLTEVLLIYFRPIDNTARGLTANVALLYSIQWKQMRNLTAVTCHVSLRNE
jgi:hypothetical protein